MHYFLLRIYLLTDELLLIHSLKMALRPYSQMEPRIRRQRLLDFNNRIQSSNENSKIREEWGLKVQRDLVKVNAYCIKPEILIFGENVTLT